MSSFLFYTVVINKGQRLTASSYFALQKLRPT